MESSHPEKPVLQSSGVTLRGPRPADTQDRLACGRDSDWLRSFGGAPDRVTDRLTPSAAQAWYERVSADELVWVIEFEGRCVGTAGLHQVDGENRSARYAIGIFDASARNRGIGTISTGLILDFAFEQIGLHRVELRVLSQNLRAIRCYEKCGFVSEGVERDTLRVDRTFYSDLRMSVLEHERRGRAGGR